MLHKTRLALAVGVVISLGTALPAYAEGIVVEELPLSGPSPVVETQAIPKSGKIDSAPLDSTTVSNTPSTGDSGGSVNPRWELYQQVQQLQDQVQKLQGTVEEQNHTIERMRSDQKARYTDLDQRVNTLNDRVTQLQQTPAPAATPGTAAPADSSEAPSANIEEEKKAYLAAYEVFRSQGPDKAIPPMLTFVSRYPNSTFAPNAYYWLGEFYLAATPTDMGSAKKNFETVLSTYPNNAKAPASLYKLGTIADLQKKPEEAKKRMQDVVTRYPNSPEAALAKAYLNPPADAPKAEAKPADKPKTPAKPKKKATT